MSERTCEKIEQGVLLKVNRSFLALTASGRDEPTWINKGQIIEIRYPHEWHFRTKYDVYAHAPTDTLQEHCEFFGRIDEKVRFENRHNLAEILAQKLYKLAEPPKPPSKRERIAMLIARLEQDAKRNMEIRPNGIADRIMEIVNE